MNHTQLRSCHAVAAEGGFTAASRVLNVGQPTITRPPTTGEILDAT